MLDFTSALYLGFHHPSSSLRSWSAFTTGAPAALNEPPETASVAREIAELQGCEAAVLGTSTFHLAWDLFGQLAQEPITIFMDAKIYPISRWGVQRAQMKGAVLRKFAHGDPAALERELATAPRDRQPVIVADGFCPGCGRSAPLVDYLALARANRGLLVTDDTQALGVLGRDPDPRMPYGYGGGGSLRWSGVSGPEVLAFSSLAKAFGVPLAVLAGSTARIRRFSRKSITRVFCSPPSIATLRATEHALACERKTGTARREALLKVARRFRRGVKLAGLALSRGLFPVQAIPGTPGLPAATLHRRLEARGVRAVLNRGEDGNPRVTFLLTSRHTPAQIDVAVAAIVDAAGKPSAQFEPESVEDSYAFAKL